MFDLITAAAKVRTGLNPTIKKLSYYVY